jgi:hypothetical protein
MGYAGTHPHQADFYVGQVDVYVREAYFRSGVRWTRTYLCQLSIYLGQSDTYAF